MRRPAAGAPRPGARREDLEAYIKRIRTLEDMALSFKGVLQAYAIQAGREVRIIVKPEEIDDLEATRLARDLAKKISEPSYAMLKVRFCRFMFKPFGHLAELSLFAGQRY